MWGSNLTQPQARQSANGTGSSLIFVDSHLYLYCGKKEKAGGSKSCHSWGIDEFAK
jgi:hypothetical protein